jgi:pentatricopeptide repeat protein
MTTQDTRAAALDLIGECSTRLHECGDAAAVRAMVTALAERACALQGSVDDRPYFARTMSRVAHLVRSHGWVDVARETLEWAMAHGAVDGYVLSELAECHLARGDVRGAEDVLAHARAAGLATDAIYTSLVKAHGRAGRIAEARRLFEQARQERALTAFTYPALIAAYGVMRDVRSARMTFECAVADGYLSAPAYTALATACATTGDLAGVDAVLSMARHAGLGSPRLTLTAIRAHLDARHFAAARRVLEDARGHGLADATCYAVLIATCHKAGRHREAKRVFASAASDARLSQEDRRRIKYAHARTRRDEAVGRPRQFEIAA